MVTVDRGRSISQKRSQYQSQPYIKDYAIDAELVENIIRKMKRGKADDLEGITCEHLIFSNALLPCILAKLFNLMINPHKRRHSR